MLDCMYVFLLTKNPLVLMMMMNDDDGRMRHIRPRSFHFVVLIGVLRGQEEATVVLLDGHCDV